LEEKNFILFCVDDFVAVIWLAPTWGYVKFLEPRIKNMQFVLENF